MKVGETVRFEHWSHPNMIIEGKITELSDKYVTIETDKDYFKVPSHWLPGEGRRFNMRVEQLKLLLV